MNISGSEWTLGVFLTHVSLTDLFSGGRVSNTINTYL
jgi:hypothetical protein